MRAHQTGALRADPASRESNEVAEVTPWSAWRGTGDGVIAAPPSRLPDEEPRLGAKKVFFKETHKLVGVACVSKRWETSDVVQRD